MVFFINLHPPQLNYIETALENVQNCEKRSALKKLLKSMTWNQLSSLSEDITAMEGIKLSNGDIFDPLDAERYSWSKVGLYKSEWLKAWNYAKTFIFVNMSMLLLI